MRKKFVTWIIVSGLIISLSGCGTIGARSMNLNPPPFAGLRADFETFEDIFTNKEEIKPAWMYWGLTVPLVSAIILADIPVSTFFDLYCLPWDLKSQREEVGEKDTSLQE